MLDAIDYIEHAQDVLEHAAELIACDARFALVTSVAIQGGTARELGSLAVITPDGRMTGYLSNGCIDRDILLNGLAALDDGSARVVHYGAGSALLDLALPCGGMLKVRIDPKPDCKALLEADAKLKSREPARLSFVAGGPGDEPMVIEYAPKPRVALAGRGAIFRATAEVAQSAGFEVLCLSPELDDLDAVRGLCIAEPIELRSKDVSPLIALDRWSAFLTLFHDHDWEPHLLRAALKTPCAFVGALGSARSQDARLSVLAELGCRPSDLARVKGPIGLVPSLRSANLIAASTIAELGSVFARSQARVEPIKAYESA